MDRVQEGFNIAMRTWEMSCCSFAGLKKKKKIAALVRGKFALPDKAEIFLVAAAALLLAGVGKFALKMDLQQPLASLVEERVAIKF